MFPFQVQPVNPAKLTFGFTYVPVGAGAGGGGGGGGGGGAGLLGVGAGAGAGGGGGGGAGLVVDGAGLTTGAFVSTGFVADGFGLLGAGAALVGAALVGGGVGSAETVTVISEGVLVGSSDVGGADDGSALVGAALVGLTVAGAEGTAETVGVVVPQPANVKMSAPAMTAGPSLNLDLMLTGTPLMVAGQPCPAVQLGRDEKPPHPLLYLPSSAKGTSAAFPSPRCPQGGDHPLHEQRLRHAAGLFGERPRFRFLRCVRQRRERHLTPVRVLAGFGGDREP